MALKVKDIVNIISDRCGNLVAGFDGLDREILYFDVMEQPNMKPWMREGVIMITTGYAVKDNKEDLFTLIQDLSDAKAAAIAIKTRFFKEIPTEIIPFANKLKFPIFFLDDEASFIEITYPIMTAIVQSKNSVNILENYMVDDEHKKNIDTKLFLDLINNKITKPNEIEYKIDFLNWPKGSIRLIIIEITTKSKSKIIKKESMDKMYNLISNFMNENNKKHAIAIKNNKFICFISDKSNKQELEILLYKLQQEIQQKVRYEIQIGISEIIYNYFSVKEVYQNVKESILIGSRQRINKSIIFIEDYKFEQLLLQLSNNEMFQNFVIDKLNLLEEYDILHQSEFLDTLKALVKCRGSRKEAALNLYLHRNTLAYRIKKIEQITGYSLSDYDNLFQLELALKIKDYM